MADSDHTRIHTAVTRRKALKATAATMISVPFQAIGAIANTGTGRAGPDPALTLWRQWRVAHAQTTALCRKQQRLETLLMQTAGPPSVEMELGDDGTIVTLSREEDIDEVGGDHPAVAGVRARARAEFAARRARWTEADAVIGYSEAVQEERDAADRAQDLADRLTKTPATTLAGVAAKLDMILQEGQPSEGCDEFPWREIRMARRNLKQIERRAWA